MLPVDHFDHKFYSSRLKAGLVSLMSLGFFSFFVGLMTIPDEKPMFLKVVFIGAAVFGALGCLVGLRQLITPRLIAALNTEGILIRWGFLGCKSFYLSWEEVETAYFLEVQKQKFIGIQPRLGALIDGKYMKEEYCVSLQFLSKKNSKQLCELIREYSPTGLLDETAS